MVAMKRPSATLPDPPPGVVAGDPAEPVIAAIMGFAGKIDALLGQSNDLAARQIAQAAAAELPGSIDRLVLQRYRLHLGIAALALLVAFSLGFGLCWLTMMPTMSCGDQPDGGRACWMWERLPVKR
jgi:hypothetical protein